MDIIIPGAPISQIRMKFSGRNGFGRIYDPRAKEKAAVRNLIAAQNSSKVLIRNPQITFLFAMPIPVSLSQKVKRLYIHDLYLHQKKPDIDNLIKFYLDCLSGIVFEDDNAVNIRYAYKIYHSQPMTVIRVHNRGEILSAAMLDLKDLTLLVGSESCERFLAERILPCDYEDHDHSNIV